MKHKKFEGEVELLWEEPDPIKGLLVHWDYEGLKPNMESLRNLLDSWGHPLPPIPDPTFSGKRKEDDNGGG